MQVFYFIVVVAFIGGYNAEPFPGYFGVIDLVLMSGIGLGMTIWLLEEERMKLAKTNKEMDSFFYSTSHDLRAPIASLLGLVNLARLELKDPMSLHYFEMVENRVQKMDNVIADILQLARSTKADLKMERVDFNKLLQDIISDVKFNSGAKAITLRYQSSPHHTLETDYSQLRIVIGNLVSNAVKYHFLQQDDPYIAVRLKALADEIVIEVEDNGIGIAKEYHDKIFTMFYRASTQSEGTGLGLYIAIEALSKLNGAISVQSEVGKGSIFSVRLPKN
jgi:signal transduction histidine kinase